MPLLMERVPLLGGTQVLFPNGVSYCRSPIRYVGGFGVRGPHFESDAETAAAVPIRWRVELRRFFDRAQRYGLLYVDRDPPRDEEDRPAIAVLELGAWVRSVLVPFFGGTPPRPGEFPSGRCSFAVPRPPSPRASAGRAAALAMPLGPSRRLWIEDGIVREAIRARRPRGSNRFRFGRRVLEPGASIGTTGAVARTLWEALFRAVKKTPAKESAAVEAEREAFRRWIDSHEGRPLVEQGSHRLKWDPPRSFVIERRIAGFVTDDTQGALYRFPALTIGVKIWPRQGGPPVVTGPFVFTPLWHPHVGRNGEVCARHDLHFDLGGVENDPSVLVRLLDAGHTALTHRLGEEAALGMGDRYQQYRIPARSSISQAREEIGFGDPAATMQDLHRLISGRSP